MSKLENKVAVITGGTSGIGLAAARLFIDEGAFVFLTGRRQAELDSAVAELGANAFGIQADSSKMADLDRLFEAVSAKKGKIDILFANAGNFSLLPLASVTEEHYDETFDANVKGVVFTVQKAVALLADGASVILTGSVTARKGSPAFSIYSASKAAVRSLARNWMLDLKDRRIRFNVVSPGPSRTPLLLGAAGPDPKEQQGLVDYLGSTIPLGRIGEPEDVARAVLFLASDDSSFFNGAELAVDGGLGEI
ncbi:oxidoreductase [Phyllobacterium phragmitis]|uniref:Oxidoreductase n=1 Tax=Phyllobacterium phragmitis TaxID=2670329 RepID=A0A2S9IR63_9HYPH|nr:SDR family oxidoreductase [Phyllobacterium phragmitis]PRD43016.1 oxidoreductase [Phyllobacterium phragmitis]